MAIDIVPESTVMEGDDVPRGQYYYY